MISFLKRIFIDNWQRKIIAIILAMVVWMVINHSITSTRTIEDIKVRVINIPENHTVHGLLPSGYLKELVALTITGNTSLLEKITGNDLEVILDASNQQDEWIAIANKNNLLSINPDIEIEGKIKYVQPHEINLALAKLVTEKVEVYVRKPIGDAPKNYLYVDVFPHKLYVTVTAQEEIIKKIRAEGLGITFNLNTISKKELDSIQSTKKNRKDVISFFVPTSWKKIDIPELSSSHIEIDDPAAKGLRIEFIKDELIPLNTEIPVTLFFPQKYTDKLNPGTISIQPNEFIKKKNNMYVITAPLLAQGVSDLFLDVVKNMMEIIIVVEPDTDKRNLEWNLQLITPIELEERYIEKALKFEDGIGELSPQFKSFYLCSRFRHFGFTFRLWLSETKKLSLKIQLKDDKVVIEPR